MRARLGLATAGVVAVVVVTMTVAISQLYSADRRADLDASLRRQVRTVAVGAAMPEAGALITPLRQEVDVDQVMRIVVHGDDVVLVGGLAADDLPAPTGGFVTADIGGTSWRFYSEATEVEGRSVVVQAGRSRGGVISAVRSMREIALAVGAAAVGMAVVLGWFVGGAVMRPVARLRGDAAAVAATGDVGRRVQVGGPAEVRDLAMSLNEMLRQLDDSANATATALDASRAFGAAVAHELRTPLTSIKTNLEFLHRRSIADDPDRAEALASIDREQARLLGLLDGLRLLARGDDPDSLPLEAVDLGDLIDERISLLRTAHARDVISVVMPDQPVVLRGWREGLAALLDNAVGNALLHGRRGDGAVNVTVTLASDAGGVQLVVDDDGRGVPADDRGAVFARFARGVGAQSRGSGLGLGFIAQQAANHGGHALLTEAPSGGARLEVHLEWPR